MVISAFLRNDLSTEDFYGLARTGAFGQLFHLSPDWRETVPTVAKDK
jgi:hypothetical protein